MSDNLAPDQSQVCQINGILLKLRKTNNFIGPRMSQNGPGRHSCCNQLIYSLLI